MLYLCYPITAREYDVIFLRLQGYLKKYYPKGQLRRGGTYRDGYVTNALSSLGFQEIILRKTKYNYMSLEIRLRPQLLVDITGYYKLTSLEDFEQVSTAFNFVVKDILRIHAPSFFYWRVKRFEAAVDIKLDKHIIPKYLFLFKQGYIPEYFLENSITLKYLSSPTNMYLVSRRVAVNWYNRFETIKEKETKQKKKFLDYSDTDGILRFETQVRDSNNMMLDILDQEIIKDRVLNFYNIIVGKGDYYTLKSAYRILDEKVKNFKKRNELRKILLLSSKYQSINKVKHHYTTVYNKNNEQFSKRINQIRALDINPVVLPQDWERIQMINLYKKIMESLI